MNCLNWPKHKHFLQKKLGINPSEFIRTGFLLKNNFSAHQKLFTANWYYMQLRVAPENPLEWLALKTNQVPIPLLHVQMYFIMAKAVMEAADAGVFDAIYQGKNTSETIAEACHLHPRPTAQLLTLLVSMEYLSFENDQFRLTAMAQKWIVSQSPHSVHAIAVYNNRVAWDWVSNLGKYLRTGQGMESHEVFDEKQWQLYQDAMQSVAKSEVREFEKRVPISKKPRVCWMLAGPTVNMPRLSAVNCLIWKQSFWICPKLLRSHRFQLMFRIELRIRQETR